MKQKHGTLWRRANVFPYSRDISLTAVFSPFRFNLSPLRRCVVLFYYIASIIRRPIYVYDIYRPVSTHDGGPVDFRRNDAWKIRIEIRGNWEKLADVFTSVVGTRQPTTRGLLNRSRDSVVGESCPTGLFHAREDKHSCAKLFRGFELRKLADPPALRGRRRFVKNYRVIWTLHSELLFNYFLFFLAI